MKNKTAATVKACLKYTFQNFGVPAELQSDNGKEFRNTLIRDYCNELNIRMIHGRPRNPQAQGQVERVNQTVKRWLAKSLNGVTEKRWIDHLDDIVFKYNISYHRGTGKSPFLLFHRQKGVNMFTGSNSELPIEETSCDLEE